MVLLENGSGRSALEDDRTLDALEALADALARIAEDHDHLVRKVQGLCEERRAGRRWQDILSEEEPPGSMQMVSQMLACLSKASGATRKELVEELRQEGASIPAIARLFGVTHQRVSNLLRR